jgi:hypothetical protein
VSDPHAPQWEDCKVCGGDHWTKDHHKFCDPAAHTRTADPGGLRAALVKGQHDAEREYHRAKGSTKEEYYHNGRMTAYMDAVEAYDLAAITPEATAPEGR